MKEHDDADEISASTSDVEILDLLALLEHLTNEGRIIKGVINIPKDKLPIPESSSSLVLSFNDYKQHGKIKRSK